MCKIWITVPLMVAMIKCFICREWGWVVTRAMLRAPAIQWRPPASPVLSAAFLPSLQVICRSTRSPSTAASDIFVPCARPRLAIQRPWEHTKKRLIQVPPVHLRRLPSRWISSSRLQVSPSLVDCSPTCSPAAPASHVISASIPLTRRVIWADTRRRITTLNWSGLLLISWRRRRRHR